MPDEEKEKAMPDEEKHSPVTIEGKLAIQILDTLVSMTHPGSFNVLDVHEIAIRLMATMEDQGYRFIRKEAN